MSPMNDTVVTSAEDKTVRVWDLRSPSPTGLLDLKKRGGSYTQPVSCIDNTGMVFAVAYTDHSAKKGYRIDSSLGRKSEIGRNIRASSR